MAWSNPPSSMPTSPVAQAYQSMGNIFLYGVGAPSCLFDATTDKMLPPLIPYAGNPMFDPCNDDRNAGYLNRADVQRALHVLPPAAASDGGVNAGGGKDRVPSAVPTGITFLSGGQSELESTLNLNAVPWASCSSAPVLNYSGASIGNTVSHLYPKILAAGIRILFLSGADDGYVPTLGTRSWMGSLKQLKVLKTTAAPHGAAATANKTISDHDQVPWINEKTGQVGGFITKYALKRAASSSSNRPPRSSNAALELAVFLSAGHAVPSFQPAGVFQVVKSWMSQDN